MGDDDQAGDAFALNEIGELVGQAPRSTAIPHVLIEIAVDHHVIGWIGQAAADIIDHGGLPIVLIGIGLLAGAVDKGNAGDIGGISGGGSECGGAR